MSNATLTEPVDRQGLDVIDLDEIDIDALPAEDVLKLLKRTLLDIYRKAAFAGMLVISLEKRGYDTSEMRRSPIVEAVRNVAIGVLAREAFAAFYSRKDLLARMTSLPLDLQKELAAEGTVEIYEPPSRGSEASKRRVELVKLRPEQIRLVFAKHSIRSVEEQAVYLAGNRVVEKMARAEISHDPDTGVLFVKNATAEEVRSYMKKHRL